MPVRRSSSHRGVRRISFTGSPDTARLIGRRPPPISRRCSFELGGKSPLIVCADADLDLALTTAVGQYDNAGQVCLAGSRLLVHASVYDRFLERLVAAIGRLRLGDPREPETQIGPLITPQHLRRVEGFVERAVADGARLLCGGRVSPALGGLYYEPTLFAEMPAARRSCSARSSDRSSPSSRSRATKRRCAWPTIRTMAWLRRSSPATWRRPTASQPPRRRHRVD